MSDLRAFLAAADLLVDALEDAGTDGLTPSAAAKKVHVDTDRARQVLTWMVARQYAHTTGNGAWTRHHAGRSV